MESKNNMCSKVTEKPCEEESTPRELLPSSGALLQRKRPAGWQGWLPTGADDQRPGVSRMFFAIPVPDCCTMQANC
eukprot:4942964-Amphidinium_carterae.2